MNPVNAKPLNKNIATANAEIKILSIYYACIIYRRENELGIDKHSKE